MKSIILFGAQYLYIASTVIFGIYFLLLPNVKKINFALFSGVDLVITYLVGLLVGNLFYNPRPFVSEHITPLFSHAPDNGFPSDHVLLTGALASIIFCYNRKLGIALYVIAILVGASRVLSGVHHWLDIFGALAVGIVSAAVIYHSLRKYLYV